ncbi:MAG: hypothetical protein R3D33_12435 [Hyphomicrobiaceae bacterium]
MQARAKAWAGNLALAAGAIGATFMFLELVVFGIILVPDDVLHNVTIDGVVRYQPDTRAVFRHPDGRQTLVTINHEGWNSTKADYALLPDPARLRVAVVGDSYVHGAFVNVDQGFPEVLERALGEAGRPAEVLRFGMDGAPLSQYLYMMRREVVRYHPDIVVVPLIHNDFDESYRFLGTRYNSSFMKIGEEADGSPVEILPQPFRPGWPDVLRELRTFRYLYYETNFYLTAKSFVSRYVWGEEEDWRPEFISSAVDIRNISDEARIRKVTAYIMGEMKKLAEEQGFLLVFAMDGVREAVYQGRSAEDFAVGRLNRIAAEESARLGLPFLDLQQTFADDFAVHRQRFEFAYDWHWNERANDLVGHALARYLEGDKRLLGGRSLPRQSVLATQ